MDGEERVEIDIRAGWLSDVKFSPNVPQINLSYFHFSQGSKDVVSQQIVL